MAYSVNFRKKVLDEVFNGMSVADASQKYNISEQAIRDWRRNPDKYLNERFKPHKSFKPLKNKNTMLLSKKKRLSIKEKLEIVRQFETKSCSIREIARMNNINHSTLVTWLRNKNHLLALYLSQQQVQSTERSVKSPEKETETMAPLKDIVSANAENKALKDENNYLKAKVAYLEKLLELTGNPAPNCKKKRDIKPLKPSERKETGQ